MSEIPNFAIKMLCYPLGTKLRETTGYDIMATDLNQSVQKVTVPVMFITAEVDKVVGRSNVERLYKNCGCNITFMQQESKALKPLKVTMLQLDKTRSLLNALFSLKILRDTFN